MICLLFYFFSDRRRGASIVGVKSDSRRWSTSEIWRSRWRAQVPIEVSQRCPITSLINPNCFYLQAPATTVRSRWPFVIPYYKLSSTHSNVTVPRQSTHPCSNYEYVHL